MKKEKFCDPSNYSVLIPYKDLEQTDAICEQI